MAALSPAAQALKGLRFLRPEDEPEPIARPRPPEPETTTMAELLALVADRQRREAAGQWTPGDNPLIVWLQVGHDEPMDQALVLKDMASAYGIYAGWRQLYPPATTEGAS